MLHTTLRIHSLSIHLLLFNIPCIIEGYGLRCAMQLENINFNFHEKPIRLGRFWLFY